LKFETLPAKRNTMEQHNLHKKDALEHIDYKDINKLGAYVNPHARMFSRRRSGFSAKAQRDFARAIKRSRFMALTPYIQH
jgi:small subunit ribosomal protein S18